jgi:hypothetical protein
MCIQNPTTINQKFSSIWNHLQRFRKQSNVGDYKSLKKRLQQKNDMTTKLKKRLQQKKG